MNVLNSYDIKVAVHNTCITPRFNLVKYIHGRCINDILKNKPLRTYNLNFHLPSTSLHNNINSSNKSIISHLLYEWMHDEIFDLVRFKLTSMKENIYI